MDKLALKQFVETNDRLVSKKSAGDNLYVLKYKRRVFFDSLWNEYLEECRGTIVDGDYEVVSIPFKKIYNYGIEDKAPRLSLDTPVTAYRKINGFMAAVTQHNGKLLVSTTGSTDSEYVDMIREMIDEKRYLEVCLKYESHTFMFECVHKNDPHIIPEVEGMYLLGYRVKSWHSQVETKHLEAIAQQFGCMIPESFQTTIGELVELSKTVKHEGFVAYTEDGQSFKIKSPYYLIKKFVARNPRTDKLMNPQVKQTVDEEYYPLIDHIQANIVEFTAMNEQARLEWVRKFLEH